MTTCIDMRETFVTPGGVELTKGEAVRLVTLRHSLRFEVETGMRMTRFALVPIVQQYGITTKRTKKGAYLDLDAFCTKVLGFDPMPIRTSEERRAERG